MHCSRYMYSSTSESKSNVCHSNSTATVEKNGKLDSNTNVSTASDADVERNMYIIVTLGSAHIKFDVCTGP